MHFPHLEIPTFEELIKIGWHWILGYGVFKVSELAVVLALGLAAAFLYGSWRVVSWGVGLILDKLEKKDIK